MNIKSIEANISIIPERLKELRLIGIHTEANEIHFQLYHEDFDKHFPLIEMQSRDYLSFDYPLFKQFKFDNIVFFALYQN